LTQILFRIRVEYFRTIQSQGITSVTNAVGLCTLGTPEQVSHWVRFLYCQVTLLIVDDGKSVVFGVYATSALCRKETGYIDGL